MSDTLLDLYFHGELVPGANPDTVKKNLATVFKSDAAKIETLFDGQAHCIKKGVDQATADKYQAILRKAGAILQVQPQGAPTQPAAPKKESMAERLARQGEAAASPAPTPARPATSASPAAPAAAPVAGGLSTAAHYERLSPEAPPAPPPPDTSGISVAASYDRLSDEAPPPPPAPDTSHLGLDAPGVVLAEARPDTPPPALPGLASMSLAPAGETLLKEGERKTSEPAKVPDLSHLSVAKPE